MSVVYSHRVRYHEVDQQGYLFNGRYLKIADVAMVEFFRSLGFHYDALIAGGTDPSLVKTEVTFSAPAHFDDLLEADVTARRSAPSASTWSSFCVAVRTPSRPSRPSTSMSIPRLGSRGRYPTTSPPPCARPCSSRHSATRDGRLGWMAHRRER